MSNVKFSGQKHLALQGKIQIRRKITIATWLPDKLQLQSEIKNLYLPFEARKKTHNRMYKYVSEQKRARNGHRIAQRQL